jgi:hypothetical protein
MDTIDFNKFQLVAGVRIESTNLRTVSWNSGGPNGNDPPPGLDFKQSGSYINVLPSVSLKYMLNSSTNIRAVYSEGLARPDPQDIAQALTYTFVSPTSESNTASLGNPNLKAELAYNGDRPLLAECLIGLVPSEHSSGERRRQGSITKAGSTHARRLLVEASWHYRRGPAVGEALECRRVPQEHELRDQLLVVGNAIRVRGVGRGRRAVELDDLFALLRRQYNLTGNLKLLKEFFQPARFMVTQLGGTTYCGFCLHVWPRRLLSRHDSGLASPTSQKRRSCFHSIGWPSVKECSSGRVQSIAPGKSTTSLPVSGMHHAASVFGDAGLVRDQNNGIALAMQHCIATRAQGYEPGTSVSLHRPGTFAH